MFVIGAAVSTMDPERVHFFAPESIAFQVVDSMDQGGARGDYQGHYPGVVRPLLQWVTESVSENGEVAEALHKVTW